MAVHSLAGPAARLALVLSVLLLGGGPAAPAARSDPLDDGGYASAVLADAPAAFWPLAETSGTTAADSAGSAPASLTDGVTLGQPGAVPAGGGPAAALDGHAGYLRTTTSLAVGSDFTLEAWVKARTNPSTGSVLSLYANGQTRTLFLDGSHFVGMADVTADWPKYAVIGPQLDPSVWHHVVFVTQATPDGSALRLYVDGQDLGSASVPARQAFSAPAVIGWSDATWLAHLDGSVQDVAVYPLALSADRVRAHYAAAGPQCNASLQALVDRAAPNAVVSVPACLYRETVRIDKPLVLAGQPGAEIRGSDVWTDWTPSGGLWTSSNTLPELPNPSGRDGRCGEPTRRCLLPQQVFVDGQPLYPITPGTGPGLRSGQFTFDGARHVVLADDPTGHTIEVSTRESWVETRSDGVTIQGFRMRYAANDAQTGGLSNDGYSNWTVQDNVLSDAHGGVVSIKDGNNLNVLRNDISRGGNLGIHGDHLTNGTVVGNHIHHNNTDQFSPTWGAGGAKVTRVDHFTFDGNEVDNNAAPGLWCDIDCHDVTYSANRVHDNATQAIIFEISEGATIRDNTIWQNGWSADQLWGAGILISSAAGADVYGNTLAWNAAGISVIQETMSDRLPVRNVHVHDNTVLSTAGAPALRWHSDATDGRLFDGAAGNTTPANRFWYPTPESGAPRFEWKGLRGSLADLAQAADDSRSTYLADVDKDALLASTGLPPPPAGQ